MNRTGFVKAVGAGAIGVAGAAMMGGSVAHAATTTNAWKIAVVYSSGNYKEAAEEAMDFLRNSGYDVGSYPTLSIGIALSDGCNVVLGVDTSTNSHIVAEAIKAAGQPVIYIEAFGTADDLNPMYGGVSTHTYTTPPNYFFRTAVRSTTWGYLAANEADGYLDLNDGFEFAFIVKAGDSFGTQSKEGFDAYLAGIGKGPSTEIVMNATGTTFTPALSTLTGNRLVGAALASGNAANVVNALADLENENLYIATTGTVNSHVTGNPTAWDFMSTNGFGLVAHYNEEACGYWAHEVWRKHQGYTSAYGHRHARAFDAAWLLANSLKFTNQFEQACDIITRFSNAPGTLLHPFADNLSMKRADTETANYDGASGPIDFLNGEIRGSYFQIWANPDTTLMGQIISG